MRVADIGFACFFAFDYFQVCACRVCVFSILCACVQCCVIDMSSIMRFYVYDLSLWVFLYTNNKT